jgi:hypothetical protein
MTVYVGRDVHRKRSQVAVVDEAGVPPRNRNVPNDPAKLVPILGALAPGTPVAFAAASGWAWLADLALPPTPRAIINDCFGLLDTLATPIARLEGEIATLAKPDPRVQALQVLPGSASSRR